MVDPTIKYVSSANFTKMLILSSEGVGQTRRYHIRMGRRQNLAPHLPRLMPLPKACRQTLSRAVFREGSLLANYIHCLGFPVGQVWQPATSAEQHQTP